MKNQEIKNSSTLGHLFYEKMKVFQSSVECLRGISIYLNNFQIWKISFKDSNLLYKDTCI